MVAQSLSFLHLFFVDFMLKMAMWKPYELFIQNFYLIRPFLSDWSCLINQLHVIFNSLSTYSMCVYWHITWTYYYTNINILHQLFIVQQCVIFHYNNYIFFLVLLFISVKVHVLEAVKSGKLMFHCLLLWPQLVVKVRIMFVNWHDQHVLYLQGWYYIIIKQLRSGL